MKEQNQPADKKKLHHPRRKRRAHAAMFDPQRFITDRLRAIDASGIRRVFALAAKLDNPVNLSIGQPDFDVPAAIKTAAINAINNGFNGYTNTQGIDPLRQRVRTLIGQELPNWKPADDNGTFETLITSGVSGGLLLAILTCVEPGDEVILPDPYFVMYPHLITMAGGKAVFVDTYPDFQFTADLIEPHITPRTKMLLFSSPSNPTGVVASDDTCRQISELADQHNLLVLSDEIYNDFCYEKICPHGDSNQTLTPSPAFHNDHLLILRGFSKSYAMTGWRLGYAAGPKPIIDEMTKLQQYSFVCAPSMTQLAGIAALDEDISPFIQQYHAKRDHLVSRLTPTFELATPGGAFYAFPKVPDHLGLSGSQFIEKAIDRNLLILPGNVFSNQDTHIRISYSCSDEELDRGIDILLELAQ